MFNDIFSDRMLFSPFAVILNLGQMLLEQTV